MSENNKIIYDWVSFTTQIHSVEQCVHLLGLSDVEFLNLGHGFYGYKDGITFEGITILSNGKEGMGICVQMSGQGCRSFETYGTGDFDGIFKLILDNHSFKSEERCMNLTRLDVAYDDFDGLLDLDVLIAETSKGNYVSRFNDWEYIVGTKGKSLNFGSKKSDTYFRCYDKKAERNRDDLDHWVRLEMKLTGVSAIGFISLDDTVENKYFAVLNNYLRFVTPNENDSNKRRWKTAVYWSKFLESNDSVSIYCKPGTEYNILSLDGFVFHQCGGAIETLIDILGMSAFMQRLREENRQKKKSTKYRYLENLHGISEDSILEFLRERGKL